MEKSSGLPYNAVLLWSPTSKCSLNCIYCISSATMSEDKRKGKAGLYNKIRMALNMSIPSLARNFIIYKKMGGVVPIQTERLIRALDATKKTFRIDFAGGEPFLIPNLVEACAAITKKHFVSINTNLITGKVDEFAAKIDPGRVSFFVASLHIKELEKHGLMSKYIDNFLKCRNRGFKIFAREVSYPALFGEAEEYKDFFKEKGINLTFGPFAGQYNGRRYPQAYTDEELKVFGLPPSCKNRTDPAGKICNAGYNIAVVFPNGSVYPCYQMREYGETGNIYEKIKFTDKLIECPFDSCNCPVDTCDPELAKKAIYERMGNMNEK